MSSSYKLTLRLPGGPRDSIITIEEKGGGLTGQLTNPYSPSEVCQLYDATVSGNNFFFKALVGRSEFFFYGEKSENELAITLETHETIQLEPGRRISGVTGELSGEYIVGIFSPGGVKENHFVITCSGNDITGEMFCMAGEAPASMPEGLPLGEGASFPAPATDDKGRMDVNAFSRGVKNANNFNIFVTTAQGSLFEFEGLVSGDTIDIIMHVTDKTEGLRASAV